MRRTSLLTVVGQIRGSILLPDFWYLLVKADVMLLRRRDCCEPRSCPLGVGGSLSRPLGKGAASISPGTRGPWGSPRGAREGTGAQGSSPAREGGAMPGRPRSPARPNQNSGRAVAAVGTRASRGAGCGTCGLYARWPPCCRPWG